MNYVNFGTKDINLGEVEEIIEAYDQGFVMTRVSPGHMEKVRSVRINLKKFELSSENRRILKKFNHILDKRNLPYENYSWEIHKLGKDFYDTKFGSDTFSANKIKEIFTHITKSNFNTVLVFIDPEANTHDGYCICFSAEEKQKIIHYCYPFYKLDKINSSFGIFMMTKAIQKFKEEGFDYIYLGSAHSPESKYKLQFKGLEWFDEKSNSWREDLEELKNRIK